MASAHSLLGLVNQLQSMENTFTSILLETILKLTSLTDAKLFVLVESADGRRFAGADQLCRAYAEGGLSPVGNDVQMLLDPTVYALRERPLQGFFAEQHRATFAPPVVVGPSSRKRGASLQDAASPRPAKERPLTNFFKREPDIIHAFNTSEIDDINASSTVVACRENGDGGGDEFPPSAFPENGASNADFPVDPDSFAEIIFTKPPAILAGETRFPNGAADFRPEDFAFIDEFMRTNPKVGPVLGIVDDSVAEKNSVSNKVTLSLIYDFAKCFFANCGFGHFKDPGFRVFFEAAFERFWDNFPNFAAWEESNMRFQERVDKRTNMCRMATPKSFLRQKIRINVINLMLTKMKPSQSSKARGKSLSFF